MNKNSFRKIPVFLFVLTLLSYLSVFISPATFWLVGLINYLIPCLLFLQFILLIYYLFRKKKNWIWPFLSLLPGFYFIDISINFPTTNNRQNATFTVLSYNARYFRERKSYEKFAPETMKWVADESSDIKCFQEFSENMKNTETSLEKMMEEKGYHSFIFSLDEGENNRGIAIFSRFPIIRKGIIYLNINSNDYQNNCIYADVVVNSDTIRIYNFHLRSMGLMLYEFKKPDKISSKSMETVTKLGSASAKRAVELDRILESIHQCPYPYLLTCDFNEIIYGNNYFKLRKEARNTFEEVGSGFGFTFNSIVFFIRIDHQFHSDRIIPYDLNVVKDVKSSDHFPLKGWYAVK